MLRAQAAPVPVTLRVEDSSGAAIAGASVKEASGALRGRTDTEGHVTVECRIPCQLRVDAEGFKGKFIEVSANATVVLEPAGAAEQVTVTAYREPLGALESPVTSRTLSQADLQTTAAISVDGQIRQLPGIEMFRRSPSLVANPSSQGMSLRGLGSTSASRTLLTLDDVPLNDPVGGWIHWLEQPQLAISNIEVARGGASDLYGSAAIGGVMNVGIARPSSTQAEFQSSYGMLGTYDRQRARADQAWPLGRDGLGRRPGHRRLYPGGAVAARAGRHQLQRARPERPAARGARSGGRCACLRAAAGSTRTGPTARLTRSTARACGATP